MLYLRLLVAVEHVEFLNGAPFLRGEVKVVITVMLILALALLRQLAGFGALSRDCIDVLFDARSRVKGDIHDIEGCFAGLFGHEG